MNQPPFLKVRGREQDEEKWGMAVRVVEFAYYGNYAFDGVYTRRKTGDRYAHCAR